jgi:hypothetical protein
MLAIFTATRRISTLTPPGSGYGSAMAGRASGARDRPIGAFVGT